NGIALTQSPIDISKDHNDRYRTIGVGIQGLHDYLALNYTNYSDLTTLSKLAESIEYGCVLESVELAKTRGSYPAFSGSMWHTGERIESFKRNSSAGYDWDLVQSEINTYGIRNSQLTSPAPNCQDGNNPVKIYNGLNNIVDMSLYDLLDENGVDVVRIEQEK